MSKLEDLRKLTADIAQEQNNQTKETEQTINLLRYVTNDLKVTKELKEIIDELWGVGTIESGEISLTYIDDKDMLEYCGHAYLYDKHNGRYQTQPIYEGIGLSVSAVAHWPKFIEGREDHLEDGAWRGGIEPKILDRCLTVGVVVGLDKILKKIRGGVLLTDSLYNQEGFHDGNRPRFEIAEISSRKQQDKPADFIKRFEVDESDIGQVKRGILLACLKAEEWLSYPLTDVVEKDRLEIIEAVKIGLINQSKVPVDVFKKRR